MSGYIPIEWVTCKEAAEHLKISEYTLRELCRNKIIPHARLGNRLLRFNIHDLDEYLMKKCERSVR